MSAVTKLQATWRDNKREAAMVMVIVALVILAIWAVLSRKAELAAASGFTKSPVAVYTVAAESGTLMPEQRYLAEAEPVQTAAVTSRVTEVVQEVHVDEGAVVARGDLLVRLDTSEVDAQLKGVSADIDRARAEQAGAQANREALVYSTDYWAKEAARLRKLRQSNAVAQSQLDNALNRLNEVEGQLAVASQQLRALDAGLQSLDARQDQLRALRSNYLLRAPFAGTVTSRAVDPGDQAAPGRMVARISSLQSMRLAFGVSEKDQPAVGRGRNVRFYLQGRTHKATIDRIHPALDSARLARAEVDLADGLNVAPGMEVEVYVSLPPLNATALIPATALAGGDDNPTVYVVIDGKARARPVTVHGRDDSNRVAVSGVEAGASVVVNSYLGWTRLADGMPVTEAAK